MNKLFSKIAALSVGLAMAVGVGVAVSSEARVENARAATEVTWTASAQGYSNGEVVESAAIDSVASIAFDKGSASNDCAYYDTGTALRIYNGGSFTVSVSSGSMSSIVLSYVLNGSATIGCSDTSGWDADNKTWTGSSSSVTWTAGTAKHVRLSSVTVTYSTGGVDPDTYSVTFVKNDSSFRAAEGMPANLSGLEDGEVVSLTGTPTRWGYTFLGWGASASATSYITSLTIDGADETVYAIWGEDHNVAGAWSDSPYSVAQARTAIDDNEHLNDVYVAGIISQVDSYNSKYSSITYWISDDGTTTNQFEVYSGKGLNGANFSSINDVEKDAEVVINGDIKLYGTTYEFNQSSKLVSYTAPSTGDIEVTFQPALLLGVGDTGTYSASTEAANPSYSFSSSDSSVLTVASNGAFEAKAAGTVKVRVDVTSDDGNGFKEVDITVAEVKTVSQAFAIGAGLASGATTDYYIKVSGFVSNLDADGKTRAVNITDGDQVIMIFFGGGNADYTTVKTSGFIGSKVTVISKVQNYSGTYELVTNTLVSVSQGDANSYGAGAFQFLDLTCETGPGAVTEDQWTALSNGFLALDSADQAEFRKAEPTGNVKDWVDRYTIIVSNTTLNDYISLGISSSRIQPFEATNDSTILLIVVISTIVSSSAIALLLVAKRRKSLRK